MSGILWDTHLGDPFGCMQSSRNLVVQQGVFPRVRLNCWPQQPQTVLRMNDPATAGISKLRRVSH